MEYNEAIDFLYNSLPVFQRQGAGAYKPGLGTSIMLDNAFGNPHRRYPTIHIAGTNGKGSTAHTLAAMLQCAGLKVGLYTSPHLVDFRERIRVNGHMIPRSAVTDFTQRFLNMDIDCSPSFFELTMTMAFEHFADENVDIAVIEAGLGGRLDSTNIISPRLCVITNISFDHTAFLGDTLEAIAGEKAGIIKPGIPVIIGEAPQPEVRRVFEDKAAQVGAPITFADQKQWWTSVTDDFTFTTDIAGTFHAALRGSCQLKNTATILAAAQALNIPPHAIRRGFEEVVSLTGLTGRWMVLGNEPLRVCDTGHNEGGWQYLGPQIAASAPGTKHIILGFVNDKDIDHILNHVARIGNTHLIFTQPSVERARSAADLAAEARRHGLDGDIVPDVATAYKKALATAGKGDMVFVGGSNFVVADLLASIQN